MSEEEEEEQHLCWTLDSFKYNLNEKDTEWKSVFFFFLSGAYNHTLL